MLSLTCKTAVRAVVYLASKFENGENSSIREIATFIAASEHTVGKLLQILVRNQVINSMKGPTGGFYITKEQLRQPIVHIVVAIDGKESFKECGLGFRKCSSDHPCPIHHDYKKGRDLMEKLFREKKVIDLCQPVNNGLAYLIG